MDLKIFVYWNQVPVMMLKRRLFVQSMLFYSLQAILQTWFYKMKPAYIYTNINKCINVRNLILFRKDKIAIVTKTNSYVAYSFEYFTVASFLKLIYTYLQWL